MACTAARASFIFLAIDAASFRTRTPLLAGVGCVSFTESNLCRSSSLPFASISLSSQPTEQWKKMLLLKAYSTECCREEHKALAKSTISESLYTSYMQTGPLFKGCSTEFINQIVIRLYEQFFLPGHHVIQHCLKNFSAQQNQLALSLEKLTNEKLMNLHSVAAKNNDVQLQEFIEGEYLSEQVESIKKISEYVAQLRRVGKGHGT